MTETARQSTEPKVSRRRFLYVGAGIVVAAAAGGGYYYLTKPGQIMTPTANQTITGSPIPQNPNATTVLDPITEKYGGKFPPQIIDRLRILGTNGIDENETKLLDLLYNIEKSEEMKGKGINVSNLENRLIDVSVENGTVSAESGTALGYMNTNLSKSEVEVGFMDLSLDNDSFNRLKENVGIKDIDKINPDLVFETARMSDFADKEVRDLAFSLYETYKGSIGFMLNEGIPSKRRKCTPLEAWAWIYKDRGSEGAKKSLVLNPISIVIDAWTKTSISDDYRSEIWSDLNEVTARLNSPRLVERYMQDNFVYSYIPYEPEGVKSVQQIFSSGLTGGKKKGACYDHALFAGFCLKKNGYDAKGMKVDFSQARGMYTGHVVCLYNDHKYFIIDVWDLKDEIYGPFETEEKAALFACHGQGLKSFGTYDINIDMGRYARIWD